MTPLTSLVMFGWIPAVLYLFKRLSPQWAVVCSFILAWLFLPQAAFPLPGLPDYAKMSATCYGVVLATIVFNRQKLFAFQPGWFDIPIVLWCVCPFASSMSNGLGLYDGITSVIGQTSVWGFPYYLGRIYLSNLEGLKKLAIGICIGGLAYIPLCMIENVMGPLLHLKLYGFNAFEDWSQARRYGGWRPVVFMNHGLMVGAWMMAAAVIGFWLWKSGSIKKIQGIPMGRIVCALMFGSLITRSTGAWGLLIFGIIIIFSAKWFRTSILVLFLVAMMSLHLYTSVTGTFAGDQIVEAVAKVTNEERAGSLEFRFEMEETLSIKARRRIWFGWGGWNRHNVVDTSGEVQTVTDSLWIIEFGTRGIVGVLGFALTFLTPILGFVRCYPAKTWFHPQVAPAASLAVVITLYTLDSLLNAMINPVYMLGCGGLAGLVMSLGSKGRGVTLSRAETYLPPDPNLLARSTQSSEPLEN